MTTHLGVGGNADQCGYLLQKHSSINKDNIPTEQSFVAQNLDYFEETNLRDYSPTPQKEQFDANVIETSKARKSRSGRSK